MKWKDPSPKDLEDPLFNAIWNVLKKWDIELGIEAEMPYIGYTGATGNHVMAILEELRPVIEANFDFPTSELGTRLLSPISFERDCAQIIGKHIK